MSKVTEKYQVTIPPDVRNSMDIKPGVDVDFREERGRFYIVKNSMEDPIEKWRGVIINKKATGEIIKELRGYGIESID